MKQIYLVLISFLCMMSANAQIVDIPDTNFKTYLTTSNCVDLDEDGVGDVDADTNDNGEIEVEEALGVTSLKLGDYWDETTNVSDLTGIETFVNLKYLWVQNFQNVSSINLEGLTVLEILHFYNVPLDAIDLEGLVSLENLSLNGAEITNFDISSNQALTDLYLTNNPNLEEVDVSNNNSITHFYCDENPGIYELNLSNLHDLYMVSIQDNENLNYINLKNGNTYALFPDYPVPGLMIQNLPNLEYMCVNEAVSNFSNQIELELEHPVTFTEYCSFTPGSTFFTLEGEVLVDMNLDGCDEGDVKFPNLKLDVVYGNNTNMVYSNTMGVYETHMPEGSYVITPQLENEAYFSVEPESFTVDFITDPTDVVQDFCITPNGDFNDLEVSVIPLNQARPGFEADYKVICKNKGTTTLSGEVTFNFDANVMSEMETTPVSTNENEGELLWDFVDLAPFQTEQFYITMLLNTPTDTNFPLMGGEVLEFTAALEFEGTDETPEDNTASLFQTVVNSFDPNDKTCLEGASITESQVGDYVTYVVRFENTGTASAINVVVKDYIDTDKYDVSSLMPLDASHEFYTCITDGNKVEFIFEDINLPFEDATNDGFVAFKLKTLSTLQPGDEFSNEAEIYFDYNAAIHTNNATTVVEDALSIEEISKEGIVSVYPNPVSNVLHFETNESLLLIAIYDLQGRVVMQQAFTQGAGDFQCDVSNLSKGMYTVQVKTAKGERFLKVIKN
ncbi:T9SS type A sorting domain-containing protein [Mangrovimonas sp. YM274]|uniref:DUF7619 domain-containing protein n=1 Tax=Mangrovimonas sp. YM274 TaxID=3070660 RepID=UPI0027DDCEE0|nr:T9SS type A sorting domain-containing protein [Mangrovimonas sp. YM274]WMI69720.1 T9SS type A sorting domain-containing protein [Mangrovimonas sp. YM274]